MSAPRPRPSSTVAHGDPQDVPPPPPGAADPGRAVGEQPVGHPVGASVVAELGADLGEDDVVEDARAVDRGDPGGERRGVRAQPLDEGGDTRPAEGAERGPHRECPPAPGELGNLVDGVAARVVDEVVAAQAHRRPEHRRVAYEGEPAVVGDVQGLVGVRRPGVGVGAARREVRVLRGGGRPQPEGPVDMHPGTGVTGGPDRLTEGVEGAGMDVTGLEDHDRGTGTAGRQGAAQGRGLDASLVVRGHQVGCAEPEVAQREVDGQVPVRAGDDVDGGSAGEAVAGGVVPGAPQRLVAGGGEAGEVGHRGAGGEPDRAFPRQAEQVEQPGPGDLLRRRVRRGHGTHHTVLVPGADQPVGGQGGRFGAADDEAEEAAAGKGGESRLARGGQQVDDLGGRGGAVGQLGAERAHDRVDRGAGGDRTAGQVRQPADGVVVCLSQRRLARVHTSDCGTATGPVQAAPRRAHAFAGTGRRSR